MKLHACMQRTLDSRRQVRHHLSVKCLFLWQPLLWGPCWQGSPSSQFTTLTACVTDSEAHICTESCLDNCQLSLTLTAIRNEGSFFSISPWLPTRRLPPKCREMASSPPSRMLVIDGSLDWQSVGAHWVSVRWKCRRTNRVKPIFSYKARLGNYLKTKPSSFCSRHTLMYKQLTTKSHCTGSTAVIEDFIAVLSGLSTNQGSSPK